LLPQQNDISDLKAAVDHQNQVLQQLASRVEAIGTMLEQSQQPTALGARSDGDTHP
jgi:hypothetical protein